MSITAVSVSKRSRHIASKSPDTIQRARSMVIGWPPIATLAKAMIENRSDSSRQVTVTSSAARSRWPRLSQPATMAPKSGRKTIEAYIAGQPFIMLTSSTAIEPRLRKKTTRMARPIAASAAATVRINSEKIWPSRSPL